VTNSYARLAAIVPRRFAKIALFVLLIGAAAFVADVLSPETPIPNADVAAKLLVAVFAILIAVGFSGICASEAVTYQWVYRNTSPHRGPRGLLVWLRVLLA